VDLAAGLQFVTDVSGGAVNPADLEATRRARRVDGPDLQGGGNDNQVGASGCNSGRRSGPFGGGEGSGHEAVVTASALAAEAAKGSSAAGAARLYRAPGVTVAGSGIGGGGGGITAMTTTAGARGASSASRNAFVAPSLARVPVLGDVTR